MVWFYNFLRFLFGRPSVEECKNFQTFAKNTDSWCDAMIAHNRKFERLLKQRDECKDPVRKKELQAELAEHHNALERLRPSNEPK